MPLYTKKPVTIEARLITESSLKDIALWCDGYTDMNDLTAEITIKIPTLEGTMTAHVGDYIIEGVKGEFYPCRADIFVETYDTVAAERRSLIQVDDVVDHEDGSCTLKFTMDHDSMKLFAEVGIKKVLTDAAELIISQNEEFDTNVGC
jgi:hypothetical protein